MTLENPFFNAGIGRNSRTSRSSGMGAVFRNIRNNPLEGRFEGFPVCWVGDMPIWGNKLLLLLGKGNRPENISRGIIYLTYTPSFLCSKLQHKQGIYSTTGGLVILKPNTVWGLRRVEFLFCFRPLLRFLPLRPGQTGPLNMLVWHDPTLLNQTCCARLATMLYDVGSCWKKFDFHQTSSSTSSSVSFVLRCEQQCCICSAITFNCVSRARALRLSLSMVRCICFARWHVSSSYGMVNEQSLQCLSDQSLSNLSSNR